MNANTVADYRELRDHGVEVSKHNQIRFNSGSETHRHVQAKATVGFIALQNGYRVGSEVEVPRGEVDVLLWGSQERLTYAVECETSPTEDVVESKVDRYVHDVAPIDDIFVLNLNDMPENRLESLEWAADQLGLEP